MGTNENRVKKNRERDWTEFRYYAVPEDTHMLALQGDEWIQCFGEGVESLHFHNHMEIGYCYYGEGEMLIGDQVIPFREGTCTMIPRNIPHTTKSRPGTLSRWEYIFADVEGLADRIFAGKRIMRDRAVRLLNGTAYVLEAGENEEISRLIRAILKEMEERDWFYQEKAGSCLDALLLAAARMTTRRTEPVVMEEAGISQLAPALDYISKRYDQPLKIGELAEVCYLSESHFRKLFREKMNMTPTDYMSLVRVQVACEMLNKTEKSILEIGQAVGFPSLSTFNRNFRKIMGISPVQWKHVPQNYDQKIVNWEIMKGSLTIG